jgi:GGDEF domain-containing protein
MPATGEFAALQAVNKLRKLLSAAIERNPQVTLSIGVGVFLDTPETSDHVVSFSDNVMYQVKTAGKNRVLHRTYISDAEGSPGRLRVEQQRALH